MIVSYRDTIAIRSFLGYLHNDYSSRISTTDTYLIAAVAAWFFAETAGGFQYNNPFGLKSSDPLHRIVGDSIAPGPALDGGKLLHFATLADGFIAAAKALVAGAPYKTSGYALALNALKNGGNQAAVDFLAALSQSQWDAMGFGTTDWASAYNADKNKLLGIYTKIGGVQLANPTAIQHPKPKPVRPPPVLPRDFNYQVVARDYIDPWAASKLYAGRRRMSQNLDGSKRR